jgi:hypothetical protein
MQSAEFRTASRWNNDPYEPNPNPGATTDFTDDTDQEMFFYRY